MTCGHDKSQHIYHEGACRPGFVCSFGCEKFVPMPHAIPNSAANDSLAYSKSGDGGIEVSDRVDAPEQTCPREGRGSLLPAQGEPGTKSPCNATRNRVPTTGELIEWNGVCQRVIDADTPEKAWAVMRETVELAKRQESAT
jgi:hypothetical protein